MTLRQHVNRTIFPGDHLASSTSSSLRALFSLPARSRALWRGRRLQNLLRKTGAHGSALVKVQVARPPSSQPPGAPLIFSDLKSKAVLFRSGDSGARCLIRREGSSRCRLGDLRLLSVFQYVLFLAIRTLFTAVVVLRSLGFLRPMSRYPALSDGGRPSQMSPPSVLTTHLLYCTHSGRRQRRAPLCDVR